jgi:polyisoprenoid-binding protein YceI
MKKNITLLTLTPLIIFFGCSKNPADNVPAADVRSATNASPATAASATTPEPAGRTFAFGPSNSSVAFVGSKVTGRHNGGFRNFAGEFQVANGRIADTGNKVVIDTTSLWTDTDRLTGHLKSPDFFSVAQFPNATFVPTSVEPKGTNSTITGNLTLHGITKQISFPANIQIGDATADISAEFFLNRFDFDMKYAGKADDLIRKEVVLRLRIKATPGKADFQSVQKPVRATAGIKG